MDFKCFPVRTQKTETQANTLLQAQLQVLIYICLTWLVELFFAMQ